MSIRGMVSSAGWLAFGLFVMAFWRFLPLWWVDLDAPWWRRYDHWMDGH
jgi:hypothetical protein